MNTSTHPTPPPPPLRLPKKKKPQKSHAIRNLAIFTLLLGVGIAATSLVLFREKSTLKIVYREIHVERKDLDVTVLSTGTVEPKNRLEIKPPVAGRIENILVKEGQFIKKGEVLAWMSSTERAALLDAARSQGAKAIARWEKNYKPTPILAPIDGTIILRNVEAGQTFTNVDPVFVMSDQLTIKAKVDETDIAEIHVKADAKVVLDAYPDQIISAHVDQIAYDAKTVNNVTTYLVDVSPDKTPPFMRSGMTANITFMLAAKKNILTIPNDALRVQDDKYSVLVKNLRGDKPLEKTIEVGLTDGKRTEVKTGLNEGEVVLVADIGSEMSSAGLYKSTSSAKRSDGQ